MSVVSAAIDHLPAVSGELNYIARMPAKPWIYTYDPPNGLPRSNLLVEPHSVPIRDLRPVAGDITLDRQGFQLIGHRSAVEGFEDEREILEAYYPETERVLRDATGADRVVVFDHTIRRHVPGVEDRTAPDRQPVIRVHVDQTVASGPQRVRDLLPEEADDLLRGRVQIINLWRPIRGPVRDFPLALCDASSVPAEDLVAQDLIYPDRRGEIYAVNYRPEHRWFYAPDMTPDEGLLLKCYDSATDGRARFAPHTAFDDPTTPADAPKRQSIELRALVFHRA